MTTDPLENPKKPPVIDVDRHNDRIYVRVDGELVAVREEATGSIVWYDLGGRFTESDKNVIRKEVWARLPWRAPHTGAQPVNRAQRRRLHHAKKTVPKPRPAPLEVPLPSNGPSKRKA